MVRFARFFLPLFAAVLLSGAGQAPPPRLIEFSTQDKADLDAVSAYLNGLRALQGDFMQIGPNGQLDQGRVYLLKPGRLRFEYAPPSPLLIVSDGSTVAVSNRKLKTVDRYPLSSTPLDLLLSDKIDLRRNPQILKVTRQPGTLVIDARTGTNRTKSNLSIVFAYPQLELRQWTVIDDQGLPTTVALRNLEPGAKVNPALFVLRDSKRPIGTKERD